MPASFTPIVLTGAFQYADGSLPGTDSFVDFLLTAELTNSTTGARVPARTITAALSAGGLLSVTLAATDDPTTTPSGALYQVTERLAGVDPPRVYYITLSHLTSPATLGLLVPAVLVPPVYYVLTGVTVPPPLSAAVLAGIAGVAWDPALGTPDQVLTRTSGGAVWADSAGGGVGLSSTTPAADATPAVVGTDAGAAHGDHVHPLSAAYAPAAALTSEAGTARAAESANATAISSEATTRTSADSTLTTNLASEASTARAAESTNAGAISTHAALTTTAHGGIVASSDPRLTDSRPPTAHAASHITGGGDTIANAVAGGAAGLLSGANATKLGQFVPTSGKTLTVSNSLTLAGTDGDTATVPVGGGTLAVRGADNVFSVAQGVRVAASGVAAGLHVPWITGDALPAMVGGASTSGNAQTGVLGRSDSGVGVSGTSTSGQGIQGSSATGSGVLGVLSGAGSSALEARYTGSATNVQAGLILRNSTSGTGATGTGCAINFLAKTTTTNSRFQAQIVPSWAVATEGSQTGRLTVNVFDSAVVAREILRGEASGSAALLGFFGHGAAAQPTLSAAATDAATTQTLANSLRTALINLGLCA